MVYPLICVVLLLIATLVLFFFQSADIKRLKAENSALASGVITAKNLAKRAEDAANSVRVKIDEDHAVLVNGNAELAATVEAINQRVQTLESKQPNATPKPKRTTWRSLANTVAAESELKEEDK
jgi:hypothetical protein